MSDNLYQVFHRVGSCVHLLASDLTLDNAMLFVRAWLEGNYNDYASGIEVKLQPENYRKECTLGE